MFCVDQKTDITTTKNAENCNDSVLMKKQQEEEKMLKFFTEVEANTTLVGPPWFNLVRSGPILTGLKEALS